MILKTYFIDYRVNGYPGQKEILAPNKEQARVKFLLWIENNFPWATECDFYYQFKS